MKGMSSSNFEDIIKELEEAINGHQDKVVHIKVRDSKMLPLFHAAILRLKAKFYQANVFPVMSVEESTYPIGVCFSWFAIALMDIPQTQREQMLEQASIAVLNSSADLIKDAIEKEFGEAIAKFLEKLQEV